MSNDDTYNGWANRETWALVLHLNNDEGLYGWAREAARTAVESQAWEREAYGLADADAGARAHRAGEYIRSQVFDDLYELAGDGTADWYKRLRDDVGSLWRVDVREVGAAFLGEDDDQ